MPNQQNIDNFSIYEGDRKATSATVLSDIDEFKSEPGVQMTIVETEGEKNYVGFVENELLIAFDTKYPGLLNFYINQ